MAWTREDFLNRNIAALTDEIHDLYFNLTMMRYERGSRLWRLPIGEQKGGPYDREIIVSGVTDCHVRDTEDIELYDIKYLCLDDKQGVLRLECNVPLEVRLSVAHDFSVAVERLDDGGL